MRRADQRKFHYIYKITRDDGRYYIGMHSTDDLEDGYFGSGKRITRSIKKHGRECHRKEILEFLPSRKELKVREAQLVTEELRSDPMCMNIAPGGGGGFNNEEHRRKFFAAASIGGKKTGSVNAKKFAKRLVDDPVFAKEYRRKLSRNKRRSLKENGNHWLGRNHTKETSEHMKKLYAQTGHQRGEKNSQFGTCWVTDGVKPVKIRKEHLDEYLSRGYSRGRFVGD